MKRTLRLPLFLLLVLSTAFAQQPAANDSPATRADIEKLFATMHIREQMRNLMSVMAKQSKQTAHESLKKKAPGISQKELDRMDAMSDQVLKDFDVEGMIDDMIPIYQKHLNKADVAVMSAYYETPTGQKLLREQPQMTAEAMQAVQPRMEKMMTKIMDEAEKMAGESAGESKPANVDKN